MQKRGPKAKYSDSKPGADVTGGMPEHDLHLLSTRKYTPGGRGDGQYSHLDETTMNGDWSWKPARDENVGENLKTVLGVPPSAAELYGPRICN
jgi:hypothetical protein